MSKKLPRQLKRDANLLRRNQDIIKRFNHLHQVDRLRPDDCVSKVAFEFYLTDWTVFTILANNDIKSSTPRPQHEL